MKVYVPTIIQEIQSCYGYLLYDFDKSLFTYLDDLANMLFLELNNEKDFLFKEINNYHPAYLGKSVAELKLIHLSLEECKQTIASEYGFRNWNEITTIPFNQGFEKAVQMVLNGQEEDLQELLKTEPHLAMEYSVFGHRATLLHYCGNNGVEFWRQQIPLNLPKIIKILLSAGVDKNAKMKVYGGEFTAKELFETSGHPYKTEIRELCLKLL